VFAVAINGLFLQSGPHPMPLFAVRPLPIAEAPARTKADAVPRGRSETVASIQRELALRGFYDGAVDGASGAKTETAIRSFEQASGLKPTGEPTDTLLRAVLASPVKVTRSEVPSHRDPIADLLAPSKQVMAVQRALTDFGYGQVSPTGLYDPATRTAIEQFERVRKIPVSGQINDRLLRELSAVTGRQF
jgi:peptidoglycan hydrolase-like protein with peptidoglycan-binding domain